MSIKTTGYTVFINGDAVATYARKDRAVAYAEANANGAAWTVLSPSGKPVAFYVVPVTGQAEEIKPAVEPEPASETAVGGDQEPEQDDDDDPIVDVTPGGEQTAEQQAAATAAEVEDLIGDTAERKFDAASVKRKIAALLAKAERTDNEAERDAFNAKAEKLMLRLGISVAELEAAGEVKPEEIIETKITYHNPQYAKTFVDLAWQVTLGLGNLTLLQSGRGADYAAYVIGHKSDVELAVQLINSIQLQAVSALHHWQKVTDRRGMSNYDKLVGSKSFLLGFGQTVKNRVAAEKRQVEETASTGAALVLASKMDRVRAAVEDMYPNLKESKGRSARYSSVAMRDGRTAGQTADLGHSRVGGSRKALS